MVKLHSFLGVGRWDHCFASSSVLSVLALLTTLSGVEVSARIKVMDSLDDETVYIVREKPIIMNIDSPSKGMLIMAKPVNACGPIAPPPFLPVNASSHSELSSPSPPLQFNLSLSSTKSDKGDEDNFVWILLVSWSASDEDCSIRTKMERAAEAGYSVVLLQDPTEEPDSDNDDMDQLTPLLAPLTSSTTSKFEFGWTDASVYACTINPVDWAVLSKNFTSDDYYLSFEDPSSMNGWFTYFIVGILVIGAVFFTIGLSYVIVQLLVLILIWIRESIVSRIQQMRRDRRRRLPASQLKKIPIQQWNSDMLQDICSICLETFEVSDRVRILPCSHVFHQACIDPWLLKQRRKCPNCKRKIVFPDENRDSDSSSDDERTPLLMGSSFRESSSSSNASASPVVTSRPASINRRASSEEHHGGHVNRAVDTDPAAFRPRRPQHHQSPSPLNSSINTSNEAQGTTGSPSATSTPQDIKGKVDQLCARVENVGRKIRKKVKATQASKLESSGSPSDLSTTVQPLLVSVTVEPNNHRHSHEATDPDHSFSQQGLPAQEPHNPEESQNHGEPSRTNLTIGDGDGNASQASSTATGHDEELEVKVVPDCPALGIPSHANGNSNNT